MTLVYVVLGTIFGFILSRSGAADYDFIQGMFLFTNLQLYGIMGAAVLVGAPGIWLIKRRGRTLAGRTIEIELKPLHRGNIAGGVLFGIGWSLAGMCPGPILVNIGEGQDLRARRTGRCAGGRRRLRHDLPAAAEAVRAAGAQGRDGRGLNDAGRSFFVSRRISIIRSRSAG